MTELLLGLFVGKNAQWKSTEIRTRVGRLAGITGILCNVLLFIGKLAVGLLSGAISVLADAVNNLSDAASSVVTLLGFQMARRPADAEHPYGHARYEYLSGLLVAVFILVMGLGLVRSSAEKVLSASETELSAVTVWIMICAMGVKVWMWAFFRSLGKKIESDVLFAAAADSRNDVIATGTVLLGCAVEFYTGFRADGYVGIAVAVFILWSGVKIARETVSPLLGRQCSEELADGIHRLVCSHPEVLGAHDLLVHDYGPGQCFATIHVELSASEDPLICHDRIDAMERRALEELGVNLVIHYDPVPVDDPEWNGLKEKISSVVAEVSPEISMHDFRLVREGECGKVCFDLAVPYGMNGDCEEIRRRITEEMKVHTSYEIVIRFDGKA